MIRIIGVFICLALLLMAGQPVLAAEPHEDPEAAEPVYSGIALLDYFSDSLDFVLQKNPAEVEARLGKIPFAHIPPELTAAADDFASAGMSIANLVAEIDQGVTRWQLLIGQFRLDEAEDLTGQVLMNIDLAYSELGRIEQAAGATGVGLGAGSPEAGTGLNEAYDRVLDRIERIRAMLALYERLLAGWMAGTGGQNEELLLTEITLQVQPVAAYVGDNVQFIGRLTSQGEALVGREVELLVDGAGYATAVTDADGYYQGTLSVPYRYMPEMSLQALYYPRETDVGFYLASLSAVVMVQVLYYEAVVILEVPENAYPGRAATVSGHFDYGASPPPDERTIEVLLDDTVVFRGEVGPDFSEEIILDAATETGEHVVTVSAAAYGRYAPAAANALLNVGRAAPLLVMGLPGLTLAPGHLDIGGQLTSEVGPLEGATVELELGRSETTVTSAAGGEFETEVKLGMGLGIIGSQDLMVRVSPQEPWHSPLVTSRPVLVLNWVNSGIILVVLVALGIYLPGALRRRLGVRIGGWVRKPVTAATPRPAVVKVSGDAVTGIGAAPVTEAVGADGDVRQRVFGWYRRVVQLVLRLSHTLFRPQQTMREFAREQGRTLGPAAKYFVELTRMVERLLYGRAQPAEEDFLRSRILSDNIDKELDGEGL